MKKQILLLSLNIDNLINFISAGLITSKNDFPIGNYMPDSLSLFPDQITLYSGKIPGSSVAMIKEYDKNLFECIVKITLKLSDNICENLNKDSSFKITSSISVSAITEIIFENTKAKDKFERAIKNSNVIGNQSANFKLVSTSNTYKKLIEDTKIKVDSINEEDFFTEQVSVSSDEIFDPINDSSKLNVSTPENEDYVQSVEFNYSKVSAYGAVIALLFTMSKNGYVSTKLFKSFVTGDRIHFEDLELSSDFVRIFEYFYNDDNKNLHEPDSEHFSNILELIVNNNKSTLLDNLILHLQDPDCAAEERVRGFYNRISKQMLDIYQSTEKRTTSELVKDLMKSFEKTNIQLYFSFFAIKSDIETLLNTQVGGLREQDYLMLAVFYGMRDGYQGLPKFIREYEGLETFTSYKMASYSNIQSKINFEHLEVKAPTTLIDLLDGNKLTIEAKLAMSSKLGLDESLSVELATKDFNYIKGSINIPLSAKPKFIFKRNEDKFTQLMLTIIPEKFNYKEIIRLAKK